MKSIALYICSLFLVVSLLLSSSIFASDRFSDDPSVDQILENERYARLDLTGLEWTSIVVGIILIVMGREFKSQNNKLGTPLVIAGALFSIPLLLVIVTLFLKAIGYAIALGVAIFVIYTLLKR